MIFIGEPPDFGLVNPVRPPKVALSLDPSGARGLFGAVLGNLGKQCFEKSGVGAGATNLDKL